MEPESTQEKTLEMYYDGGAISEIHGCPAENGTLLIARSPDTDEKLCEFVILGNINKVFTEHGIDFSEYDDMFRQTFNDQDFTMKTGIYAAQVRLRNLGAADEEKRALFEQYIFDAAFLIMMSALIQYPEGTSQKDITDDKYLDLVSDDDLMGLIDEAAELGKPEITAFLMQKLHERQSGK